MKTKKMEHWYQQYCTSNATELYHVYGQICERNRTSYERIKARAKELHAVGDVRILTHSCHHYTCGYVYPNPETGELMFRVETRENTYVEAL